MSLVAPTLETDRLILRAIRPDDLEAFERLWADPAVTRFITGDPPSRRDVWEFFLRRFGLWPALGFGYFVVEDRSGSGLVGEVGFHELRRPIKPSIEGTLEAGWLMRADAQGRGLAAEAMGAALAWARQSFPERRVTCLISEANAPSLRLAARLGFQEFARCRVRGPARLFEMRA